MELTLQQLRSALYTAVVCDALDALGYRHQALGTSLKPLTAGGLLAGRAKTTLWADMAEVDPKPYELELKAVDACQADDVLVAAAAGSLQSGIWGELLAAAAKNAGCVGAIIDGAVRDLAKIRAMAFPVFARGVSPYDSLHRQRVVDLDLAIEIGGVRISPGELILADEDGIVVVPRAVEAEALRLAWEKVHAENRVRDAIRGGMKAEEAFRRFGVL